MKLYELTESYLAIERMVSDEDMPMEQAIDSLNDIKEDIETKVSNITKLVRLLDDKRAQIACEEARLKEFLDEAKSRRETKQKRIDWLTNYVINSMSALDIKKLEYPEFDVSVRNNPASVVIDAEAEIPSDFKKVVTKESPDKKAIKEALSSGEEVAGCKLVQTRRLVIK